MCPQQTIKPFEALESTSQAGRWCRGLALALLCLLGLGCNSFSSGRLVKELQTENERLLSEYRAQRDRTAELEKVNQRQAERLAESEKLLARVTQGGTGRLSSLPSNYGSLPPTQSPLPTGSSSRASSREAGGDADSRDAELRWQPRLGTPR